MDLSVDNVTKATTDNEEDVSEDSTFSISSFAKEGAKEEREKKKKIKSVRMYPLPSVRVTFDLI